MIYGYCGCTTFIFTVSCDQIYQEKNLRKLGDPELIGFLMPMVSVEQAGI
jgi:hypothetical protein